MQAPGPTYKASVQPSVIASAAPVSAMGSAVPAGNNGAGYKMPTVTTVTGIPSYSLPGSTPTSKPAQYTGAAVPLAKAGMGAFAAGLAVAVAAF